MLKSILGVFAGVFGLILRVMAIIALFSLGLLCLFTMLTIPFVWGGLLRLAGLAACAALIYGILRLSRDPDDSPPDDDFRN